MSSIEENVSTEAGEILDYQTKVEDTPGKDGKGSAESKCVYLNEMKDSKKTTG